MFDKKILLGIVATVLASLCCVVPVLAVLAGLGSFASMFSWMEPYHNYLIIVTVLVLVYVWWDKLKAERSDVVCCDSTSKAAFLSSKKFLAGVTLFSVLMLSFPLWGYTFFDVEPECSTCAAPQNAITPKEHDAAATLVEAKEMKGLSGIKACTSEFVCTGTGHYESDALMAEARNEVHEIHSSVLKKMLDDSDDVIVLDVRVLEQRAEGEIYADDMMAISRTDIEFEVLNKIKNKDAVIVTYSRSGGRGLFAAQTLKKLGYKNANNLKGGLRAWVSLGYPIENALGIVTQIVAQ